MREVLLLVRLFSRSKARRSAKKKRFSLPGPVWVILAYFMLPLAFFLGFFTPVLFPLLKSLNFPLVERGILSPFLALDLLMAPMIFFSGVMLLIQFSQSLIIGLFDNEMIPVLCSMPFHRSSIVFTASLDSLVQTGMFITFLGGFSILYAVAIQAGFFASLGAVVSLFLFLLGLGMLIATWTSRFVGRTSAKRFTQVLYFFGALGIFGAPQVLIPLSRQNPDIVASKLQKWIPLFLHRFWPHTFFLKAIRGDVSALLVLSSTGIALFLLAMWRANGIELSLSRKKTASNRTRVQWGKKFPLLKKEILLMFRDGQMIWYVIYPVIFPLIMFRAAKESLLVITLFFTMVASLYSSLITTSLFAQERKVWPVPLLFPISSSRLIGAIIRTSVGLFWLEYLVMGIVLFFLFQPFWAELFLFVPVFFLLRYGALIGIRMYLQDAGRDISRKGILLKGKEILFLEVLTMGFSGLFLGILLVYRQVFAPGSTAWFSSWPPWLVHSLFPGAAVGVFVTVILLSSWEKRRIQKLLENLDNT
ncbi:MAG TPA: hypothetical protein P5560_03310 [Thermotogota bacterium]|nr:hypothetical protein [Thermotogota bacterium]HRW91958.1 hypothetical protein [Thermotogota bacterium]